MKKLALILLALLLAVSSTACSGKKGVIEVSKKYLETEQGTEETSETDSLYALTDWLTPEEEYICPDGSVDDNDRYYTQYRLGEETMDGYISLKSGEFFSLCPDPLCSHKYDSECRYREMSVCGVSPKDKTVLYAVQTVPDGDSVCDLILKLNTKTGEITELHRFTDGIYATNLTSDYLYLNLGRMEKITNEDGTAETQVVITVMRMDLETNELETLGKDEDIPPISDIVGDYFMLTDNTEKRIYITDIDRQNEQTVFDFSGMSKDGKSYICFNLHSEPETNTAYFGLRVEDELGDDIVYRIDLETLECEQVLDLDDNILSYYLTDDYIYFTVNDPVNLGQGRVEPCVDETGNKIYRVPRDNTTAEPELIFYGENKLFFNEFWVMGDYLYLKYNELIQTAGMTYFRNMNITARVNFKENTIKWLIPES